MNTLIYILIIVSFLAGIYYCIAMQSPKFMERNCDSIVPFVINIYSSLFWNMNIAYFSRK